MAITVGFLGEADNDADAWGPLVHSLASNPTRASNDVGGAQPAQDDDSTESVALEQDWLLPSMQSNAYQAR